MPAYNAQKYIKSAIESVLEQSYNNWELIVINDGSSDNTLDIVKSFDDKRIVVINQPNGGVSVARNNGLKEAKGEYVTFLDADDILPKKSLEIRINYLEENLDVDLVDGKAYVMNEDLKEIIRVYEPKYKGELFPKLVLLNDKVYLTYFYMVRREVLKDVKFKEKMTHSEDLLFFINLAAKKNIIYAAVDELIFYYRKGHESATKNLDGITNGYIELFKEIKKIKQTTLLQKIYLKFKISKILFFIWVSQKNILKAIKSVTIMIKS
jgi:glycosyltransferase involved in cell wall biosynthesis